MSEAEVKHDVSVGVRRDGGRIGRGSCWKAWCSCGWKSGPLGSRQAETARLVHMRMVTDKARKSGAGRG